MTAHTISMPMYRYEHVEALFDGRVELPGVQVRGVPAVTDAFQQLARREVDAAEFGTDLLPTDVGHRRATIPGSAAGDEPSLPARVGLRPLERRHRAAGGPQRASDRRVRSVRARRRCVAEGDSRRGVLVSIPLPASG